MVRVALRHDVLRSGDDDGSDEGHQQHQGSYLERQRPLGEQGSAQLLEFGRLRLCHHVGRQPESCAQNHRQYDRGYQTQGPLPVVRDARVFRGSGEHHGKKNDDGNGATVYEHLHQGQELGEQQQVGSRRSQERKQQEQGRVHNVSCRYHPYGPAKGENCDDHEQGKRHGSIGPGVPGPSVGSPVRCQSTSRPVGGSGGEGVVPMSALLNRLPGLRLFVGQHLN